MAAEAPGAHYRDMDTTPPREGVLTERCTKAALATYAMVHLRAHELASIAGHFEPYVSQANYEQAVRELGAELHQS